MYKYIKFNQRKQNCIAHTYGPSTSKCNVREIPLFSFTSAYTVYANTGFLVFHACHIYTLHIPHGKFHIEYSISTTYSCAI